ncbi:MAG TPA: pyruvate, phosphate dikinase [Gaiellaceae bacterium]|nr:pyruvate, phosphate dikinase [Gaiellaceae bacterium]
MGTVVMSTSTAFVYDFNAPAPGGRELLGGKGHGLSEMAHLRVPIPDGFTITTEACRAFLASGDISADLERQIDEHIRLLELRSGLGFGDPDQPLLLSVRSGAAISMPGMMDTILDLGLNDAIVEALSADPDRARFAFDSYRRLIQMYGNVVDGIEAARFEQLLEQLKTERGVVDDSELDAKDLRLLIGRYKALYEAERGHEFPQSPHDQLLAAVRSVFASWNSPRAQTYRHTYEIPDDLGTAVNVMRMVFGNRDERSATGVCFSRDPSTGVPGMCGEFLVNAQGEDVVAGIRRPADLAELRSAFPDAYAKLERTVLILERHYRDMQDIEFTIESGRLYILQTRSAKRTATAAVRVALSMVHARLITREEALLRVDPGQLEQLLHPTLDPNATYDVLSTGLAASPGAASGKVVFDPDTAVEWAAAGEDVVLVRAETSPDDIHGLVAARAILTAHGGIASHAALVARGMGKPCVASCSGLVIDEHWRTATLAGTEIREGDVLTIDGSGGRVIRDAAALRPAGIDDRLGTFLAWADDTACVQVRANADTPTDAETAKTFGARGIGLCRTEHMFFGAERLPAVQRMILAEEEGARRAALDELLPFQQSDFEQLFETMAGLPVTIRLLDPPLHEFLPPLEQATDDHMRARILELHESNPMLGTRGCRLGIEWPEIYEMQVRAIARAANAVVRRRGHNPRVEIMIPLVAFGEELRRLRMLVEETLLEERCRAVEAIGTMIELPRACVQAHELAREADFFSFGTNDLTQTALGFSRDDAEGKFLTKYLESGVLERDPFATLDQEGVGELMRQAVEGGRSTNARLEIGICGEHGGDPASIAFCHGLRLDYVSCSPYRVPVARLAAARAVIEERQDVVYQPAGG